MGRIAWDFVSFQRAGPIPDWFLLFLGCCCNSAHPIWTSQSSVSVVIHSLAWDYANMCKEIYFSWKSFNAWSLFRNRLKMNDVSFWNSSFNGDVVFAEFGTNCLIALQWTRRRVSLVAFCPTLRRLQVSIVFDVVFKRRCQIALPRPSRVSVRELQFFRFRVTPASNTVNSC